MLSVFTLGQQSLPTDYGIVFTLLEDLYDIILISAGVNKTSRTKEEIHRYVASKHRAMFPYFESRSNAEASAEIHPSTPAEDYRIAPLRLLILILCSCLQYGFKPGHDSVLANLASQLRQLLESSGMLADYHAQWMPFVGALVWCYAIGVRFAEGKRDRTWFLMQFLRTSQSYILDATEVTSSSISMVLDGLEGIEQLPGKDHL